MKNLTWNKALPTKVGWYWRRNLLDKHETEPEIVHVREFGDSLAIGNCPLVGWKKMLDCEWAGPIPLPEEPWTISNAIPEPSCRNCDDKYRHAKCPYSTLAKDIRKILDNVGSAPPPQCPLWTEGEPDLSDLDVRDKE